MDCRLMGFMGSPHHRITPKGSRRLPESFSKTRCMYLSKEMTRRVYHGLLASSPSNGSHETMLVS